MELESWERFASFSLTTWPGQTDYAEQKMMTQCSSSTFPSERGIRYARQAMLSLLLCSQLRTAVQFRHSSWIQYNSYTRISTRRRFSRGLKSLIFVIPSVLPPTPPIIWILKVRMRDKWTGILMCQVSVASIHIEATAHTNVFVVTLR